jgi:hypothetical protein
MFNSCSQLAIPADHEQEMTIASKHRSAVFIPINPDNGLQMGYRNGRLDGKRVGGTFHCFGRVALRGGGNVRETFESVTRAD